MAVHVPATALPISTRPIGIVPVSAIQSETICTPSRYRSHGPGLPTVPQSSSLCHPVPRATPDENVTAAKSERICRIPDELSSSRTMGSPAAVCHRVRTIDPVRAATFTRKLTHAFG